MLKWATGTGEWEGNDRPSRNNDSRGLAELLTNGRLVVGWSPRSAAAQLASFVNWGMGIVVFLNLLSFPPKLPLISRGIGSFKLIQKYTKIFRFLHIYPQHLQNRLPASCSTKQSTATPSSTQSQQQSGSQTAFEPLNEPGRCPVHIAQQQPPSTEQQSATAGTGTAELFQTDCCLPKSAPSSASTSAQGAAMVQAGVQLGNGLRSGNSSGNNHHRKESTEGAVIIIPINRAEMDAEQAEPQQASF